MHDERSRLELSYAKVVRLACDQMEQLDELRLALAETEARANKSIDLGRNESIDAPNGRDHNTDMTEFSRDELKAHLESQDLKVDARLKSFEQTVKDAMGEIRLEISNIGGDLKAVERDLSHLKDMRSTVKNTGLGVILAVVASALTIYFGVQSSNSSLVSSTISGFGVGKDVATAQASMAQQTKDVQDLLKQVQDQQKMIQKALETPETPPKSP
ncbi:hypothetical protein MRY17_13675 [Pseudomonas orientalis]|uniref:hypothetical protein n=1 Tax=Pseudomonas orientalis TaxID=76758 RepID=UPI001FAF267B|nr:hypothetical protein [Pseudomonas orientalis]UOB21802.1 hypothetical protein MRY17_13675 [Pseudomonas orientalis]